MKIANAVLLMAAVGSANAEFLRNKESKLECLENCASVAGRKKLSDIKKTTYNSATHCAESCTTDRIISGCADTCYKKFAKEAQKAVDKEVKNCEKKCDPDDSKCKKNCNKGKGVSEKKIVKKIDGKVTEKAGSCLGACVYGSEGLDFMDHGYSEDYDYYLEDPEDSEDFDYEDSMDLEDYEDFEDEDSEDFELIAEKPKGKGDEKEKSTKKESKYKNPKSDSNDKRDEKKGPKPGSKVDCKDKSNKNHKDCKEYNYRKVRNFHQCFQIKKKDECKANKKYCEYVDKSTGCVAKDVFMAYA